MMQIQVGLTLMLVVSTLGDIPAPVVHTSSGSIEGYWKFSRNGRRYQAYEGIPYALPPVGPLRFEPPQPMASWTGVLPAKFNPSPCIQYTPNVAVAKSQVLGDEDCLYMHIYTNFDNNHTELLPVMIYIYGGGFGIGEAVRWAPTNLMNEDMVFVSMNYRLAIFGYLSTGDAVVPGNMGMKDQALVIQWVSKNIKSFGGDPNQVTLAGISSGAACVHLHSLSPMTQGLFHRAIGVSGSALNSWVLTEASSEKAKKLGALAGCPTDDNERMIRCLKSRPARTIYNFYQNYLAFLYNPFVPLGPVVENGSADPFLDKPPIEIIDNGDSVDIPWIRSVTTDEGIYPTVEFFVSDDVTADVNKNWEVYAPYLLDYNYTIPVSEHATVARYIRNHYLGEKKIENSTTKEVISMCGDRLFGATIGEVARKQAKMFRNPVWFYVYGYHGEYSVVNEFAGYNANYGTAHGDEGYIVFDLPGNFLHREQDVKMCLEFVRMWYTFMKTGKPNLGVDWQPVVNSSSDALNYLMITGPGEYSMKSKSNFMNKDFWSTIDFDENKLPFNKKSLADH